MLLSRLPATGTEPPITLSKRVRFAFVLLEEGRNLELRAYRPFYSCEQPLKIELREGLSESSMGDPGSLVAESSVRSIILARARRFSVGGVAASELRPAG